MTTQTLVSFSKQNTVITKTGLKQLITTLWNRKVQLSQHRKTYFQLLRKPGFLIRDIGLTHQQVNREIDRTSLLRWK